MPRDPNPIGAFGKIHRIKRANGSWSARAYVRDADGRRRLVARTSTTGEAAERRLRQALGERTAGLSQPDGSPLRVQEMAERWFADLQRAVAAGERSPNTARLYRLYLDRHILPTIGDLPNQEATVARLDEFITATHTQQGTATAKACRSILNRPGFGGGSLTVMRRMSDPSGG
jgi:hypothetical protein